jgi:hypothetical protein
MVKKKGVIKHNKNSKDKINKTEDRRQKTGFFRNLFHSNKPKKDNSLKLKERIMMKW